MVELVVLVEPVMMVVMVVLVAVVVATAEIIFPTVPEAVVVTQVVKVAHGADSKVVAVVVLTTLEPTKVIPLAFSRAMERLQYHISIWIVDITSPNGIYILFGLF